MGDTSECEPDSVGSAAPSTSARTSALTSAWASPARREDAPGWPPSTALSLQAQHNFPPLSPSKPSTTSHALEGQLMAHGIP